MFLYLRAVQTFFKLTKESYSIRFFATITSQSWYKDFTSLFDKYSDIPTPDSAHTPFTEDYFHVSSHFDHFDYMDLQYLYYLKLYRYFICLQVVPQYSSGQKIPPTPPPLECTLPFLVLLMFLFILIYNVTYVCICHSRCISLNIWYALILVC